MVIVYLDFEKWEWRRKILHRALKDAASRTRCSSTKVYLCVGAKNFVIYVRESESLVMMFQFKFCIHNEKAFCLIVHVGK